MQRAKHRRRQRKVIDIDRSLLQGSEKQQWLAWLPEGASAIRYESAEYDMVYRVLVEMPGDMVLRLPQWARVRGDISV